MIKKIKKKSIKSAALTKPVIKNRPELMRVKKKVSASQKFIFHIVNKLKEGFAAIDENGKQVLVNDEFCKMTGFNRKELLNQMPPYKYWADEGLDKINQAFEKTLKGFHDDYELIFKKKNGERFTALVSPRMFLDAKGKRFFMATVKDITEQKRAEDIICKNKEFIENLIESMQDGFTVLDSNGVRIMANKAFYKMTGFSKEELIGIGPPFPFWPPEHLKEIKEAFDKMRNERTKEIELIFMRKNGERFPVLISPSFLIDQGEITSYLIIIKDITERKKMEEELLRREKLESLGVLAGGIAHDFNNLLAGIFSYVEMAYNTTKENKVSGYLSKSLQALTRTKNLSQQLLTFAKGGDPSLSDGHLFPFLQESIHFVTSGSNVSCLFDIPDNLWLCRFDKNQIGRAIDNIVINAKQSMPTGGNILISAKNFIIKGDGHAALQKGNYVKISIKDSGTGIPIDILPNIYDPFFTTKQTGSGLGLAISYSIINKHGGCINVESEPGKGSAFHIFLPATQEPDKRAEAQAVSMHKGSGKILVMDDQEFILEIFRELLSQMGYSVKCAADGNQALNLIDEEKKKRDSFTAIILDLTIPGGMGGKETIVKIREIYPLIPVFVCSGYSDDPVISKPTDYGFTDSICKPFRIAELANVLNRHLPNKA